MTTFTPRPLSATDGYLFQKGEAGTPFTPALTEAEENEARMTVIRLYRDGLDPRMVVLPESGRLPLVNGGRRITYHIRPVAAST